MAVQLQYVVVIHLERATLLGAGTLLRHGRVVTGHIQSEFALPGDIVGEVGGKAVGVVEFEHHVAGNFAALQVGQRLLQQLHTVVQSPGELLLLEQQGFFHLGL